MTTATKRFATQEAPAPAPAPEQADKGFVLTPDIEHVSRTLDEMAAKYATAIDNPALGRLQKAMVTARAIDALRNAITKPFMAQVMSLMNSPLGFKTDLPKKGETRTYSEQEVKDVLVAALLNGVYPYDNEFNIIAGNLYIAQAGYRRKVREIPGLTDLELQPGIPTEHNGRTVVRFGATWKLNGDTQRLLDAEGKPGRYFAASAYLGAPDAIVGKATRKALKAIYDQVTGSEHTGQDDSEVTEVSPASVQPAVTRTEQLADAIHAQANGKGTPAPTDPIEDEKQLDMLRDCIADALGEADTIGEHKAALEKLEASREKLGKRRIDSLAVSIDRSQRRIANAGAPA